MLSVVSNLLAGNALPERLVVSLVLSSVKTWLSGLNNAVVASCSIPPISGALLLKRVVSSNLTGLPMLMASDTKLKSWTLICCLACWSFQLALALLMLMPPTARLVIAKAGSLSVAGFATCFCVIGLSCLTRSSQLVEPSALRCKSSFKPLSSTRPMRTCFFNNGSSSTRTSTLSILAKACLPKPFALLSSTLPSLIPSQGKTLSSISPGIFKSRPVCSLTSCVICGL